MTKKNILVVYDGSCKHFMIGIANFQTKRTVIVHAIHYPTRNHMAIREFIERNLRLSST